MDEAKTPLLAKLYVWSIAFEPLLFFVLFEQTAFGITGNVSRFLQMLVVVGLVGKFLAALSVGRSVVFKVPYLNSPLYLYYIAYFFLAIIAGIIAVLSGGYYQHGEAYDPNFVQSGFAAFLNSEVMRPIFEYAVAAYYFAYFIILPQYMLKTERAIEYFFSVFKVLFTISFVVGVIDLVLSAFEIYVVPRHLADWRMVGFRFHGLAGEPRDAFVYLFLGLALFHLRSYFSGRPMNKWWVIGIVAAAMFTQSASGLLGLLCFIFLYVAYSLNKLSIKQAASMTVIFFTAATVFYVAAVNSPRIMDYARNASEVWYLLEAGKQLPYLMYVQSVNIFPVYDLIVKARNLDLMPVIIGSGFGSASAINNVYIPIGIMNNPHSQFVRLIYESGIVGVWLFIMAFFRPVTYLTQAVPKNVQRQFILLALLLLGCFFGHRSSAAFIYTGILIATFRVMSNRVVSTPFSE